MLMMCDVLLIRQVSGCLDELQMVANFPSNINSFTLIDVDLVAHFMIK